MGRISERDGFLRGGTEGKPGESFYCEIHEWHEKGKGRARSILKTADQEAGAGEGVMFAYMRTSEVGVNVNKEI